MNKHMTIGLDLAKRVFAVIILDERGKEVGRKTLRRSRVLAFFANTPQSRIGLEACGGAHYWARELTALGHDVSLLPPQHLKGYLRGQKNDDNDARAIAEALFHGRVRPVAIKSVDQQDAQAIHTIRRSINKERVMLSNQLRGLLAEYGIVMATGRSSLRTSLPEILAAPDIGLTARLREMLRRQYGRLLALDEELAWYDRQIALEAREDEVCQRLQAVPGFGPINTSLLKGWMGDGKQFATGREASAALGLVPRQYGTGGKVTLSGITKRGDGYVRSQLVHGARAVVSRAAGKRDPLSLWIQRIKATRGFNKAVVALANKLVRIAWVIIARGESYRPALATQQEGLTGC